MDLNELFQQANLGPERSSAPSPSTRGWSPDAHWAEHGTLIHAKDPFSYGWNQWGLTVPHTGHPDGCPSWMQPGEFKTASEINIVDMGDASSPLGRTLGVVDSLENNSVPKARPHLSRDTKNNLYNAGINPEHYQEKLMETSMQSQGPPVVTSSILQAPQAPVYVPPPNPDDPPVSEPFPQPTGGPVQPQPLLPQAQESQNQMQQPPQQGWLPPSIAPKQAAAQPQPVCAQSQQQVSQPQFTSDINVGAIQQELAQLRAALLSQAQPAPPVQSFPAPNAMEGFKPHPEERMKEAAPGKSLEQFLKEIKMPWLTPDGAPPKVPVLFIMQGYGKSLQYYHHVALNGKCLSLFYDTRYEGNQFIPEGQDANSSPIIVRFPKADDVAFEVKVPHDFSQRMGVLDIINLVVVRQLDGPEDLVGASPEPSEIPIETQFE